jgi:hypothetical protein
MKKNQPPQARVPVPENAPILHRLLGPVEND